jgi:hypothetical protein
MIKKENYSATLFYNPFSSLKRIQTWMNKTSEESLTSVKLHKQPPLIIKDTHSSVATKKRSKSTIYPLIMKNKESGENFSSTLKNSEKGHRKLKSDQTCIQKHKFFSPKKKTKIFSPKENIKCYSKSMYSIKRRLVPLYRISKLGINIKTLTHRNNEVFTQNLISESNITHSLVLINIPKNKLYYSLDNLHNILKTSDENLYDKVI